MAFPIITYKYNSLEEGPALAIVMDQKMEPFAKFIPDGVMALCEVEFEKIAQQQHGRIYRVEANLTIDGTLHRAEATEESFELAIDEVRDELNKKLRRGKDKETTLLRRMGHKMKERFMNGGGN